MTTANLPVLTAKDFTSDQEVRWCPGCGDYAILAQTRKVLAKLSAKKENTVFVSGIGCSSRFPYYMDTYGFHSIHGRAPAIATGIKIANPELDVWMVTGDGDGLSIGGNHLMHILRRNVNVKMMMFNNRIYGLTKGQYSPTSEVGKKTKSSPMGSIDMPLSPLSIAVAAQASFVARSVDVDKNLPDVLEAAANHKGTTFVEIYQDCNIFNHKAFEHATDKDSKQDNLLYLEHDKPMIFGKDSNKGIVLDKRMKPKVVTLGEDGITEDDLLIHDETDGSLAYLLSRMRYPDFPEPVGILHRRTETCYEDILAQQVETATAKFGPGTLDSLLNSGETYTIEDEANPTHGLHE